jgi:hypothetical protein
MNTPPTGHPSSRQGVALFWALAAFCVSLIALSRVCYLLRNFYLATASLPTGTQIRPMGLTFALGITSIASILLGEICALVAGIIALVQQRRRLVLLAVLAALLALVPAFVSGWGFNHIVEVRKLVLSK